MANYSVIMGKAKGYMDGRIDEFEDIFDDSEEQDDIDFYKAGSDTIDNLRHLLTVDERSSKEYYNRRPFTICDLFGIHFRREALRYTKLLKEDPDDYFYIRGLKYEIDNLRQFMRDNNR